MKTQSFFALSILLLCTISRSGHAQWIAAGGKPDAVVAADGSGTHKTVQEAVDAALAKSTKRFFIQIKPGTYKEKLRISKDKGPITFYGDDATATVLTYDDYAGKNDASGKPLGTGGSWSVNIDANDFAAENITLENTHPKTPGSEGDQALAVSFNGDRAVFRDHLRP